jgi:hypothetical protein
MSQTGPLIVKHWKIFGLAGLAGVAATGVVVIRAERRRQAMSPDEVRARLHQRYEAVKPSASMPASRAVANPVLGARRRFWQELRPKRRSSVTSDGGEIACFR